MKLLTPDQMRAVEKEADTKGVSYAQMMHNAGRGLAEIVHALGQEHGWRTATGIVGSGNNGGDALVALAWLAQAGWRTYAILLNRKPDGDELIENYLQAGGELAQFTGHPDPLDRFLEESDLLLDGLLGTGIQLPLRKEAALLLQTTKTILASLELPPFIVAVDCPSGMDCETGKTADETIPADLTLAMAAVKTGHLKLPAFEYLGALQVVNIGLPEKLEAWDSLTTEAADWEMVSAMIPVRTPASHKGTFGTAFVVAGSTSYTGAALLAGKAAYRIGAGLVTMAVAEPLHSALAGHLPEATWILLPHKHGFISEDAADDVLKNIKRATALLLGPGLGDKETTGSFIEHLLPSINIPVVLDADGLRHLSRIQHWENKLTSPAVLTPHPGEMSALTGLSVSEIQSNREMVALNYAKESGHVIVLKGAFTVIASPDGRSTVIPVATPALARAGTGDVLAGLITGLLAQGVQSYNAAIAGAFIHAQAGLLAAETLGTSASVLASDVLNAIPEIISELE
ncbi:MAG: NAD(P)H-hydrate dehydratase [Anaerolineales bacterium]|nr:NAD(P)H-hydrate dehydratase [Anaerolineales bacterium]